MLHSSAEAGHPPQDLPDFILRWRDFRPRAMAVAAQLQGADREIVGALIELADRAGPSDLAPPPQKPDQRKS